MSTITLEDLYAITETDMKAWHKLAHQPACDRGFKFTVDTYNHSNWMKRRVDLAEIEEVILDLPILSYSDVIRVEALYPHQLLDTAFKKDYYSYNEAQRAHSPQILQRW